MNNLLLYCRPGFEKECAAEITSLAEQQAVVGAVVAKAQSGYVLYQCYQPNDAAKLVRTVPFEQCIFIRQWLVVGELLRHLPSTDRITPILQALHALPAQGGDVRVEVPDTDEAKVLLNFCRRFTVPLRACLRSHGKLHRQPSAHLPVIHLFFIAPGTCYPGYSLPAHSSPFFMGIPRLKFPAGAPSRSTLKLDEAFHTFIPLDEWDERLKPGLNAVDLGASPGGWTWQLVRKGMMVYAVDNGQMDAALLASGQVKHFREDGFTFSPPRNDITWLVCDMVEKSQRVTELIIKWLINGWCRETIFNLKLPMKKRYDQVMSLLEAMASTLQTHGINAQIRARHLYHDREEVTVHIRRIWASKPIQRYRR